MGSSPSSCSSYLREYRANFSGNRAKTKNIHQNLEDIKYSSAFHGRNCCYRFPDLGQGHCHNNQYSLNYPHPVRPSPSVLYTSGISYSLCHSNRCSSNFHCSHGKTYRTRFRDDKLHKYPGHGIRVVSGCYSDSDPEYCTGSVRDSSIAAQFGSCSSASSCGGHPNHSSTECEICQQLMDSAHSTYGSSDIKDTSDSGSCASNVFYGGAPDQLCSDASSDRTSELEQLLVKSNFPCSNAKCSSLGAHCSYLEGNNTCDISTQSESTLNLSDISSNCDCSVNSSYDDISVCCHGNHCDSPDLSLSGVSGISTYVSTENLFSKASHSLSTYSSIPKTIPKGRVKVTSNVHSFTGSKGHTQPLCSTPSHRIESRLCDHNSAGGHSEILDEDICEEETHLLSDFEFCCKDCSSNQKQVCGHVMNSFSAFQHEIPHSTPQPLADDGCHDNIPDSVPVVGSDGACHSAIVLANKKGRFNRYHLKVKIFGTHQ